MRRLRRPRAISRPCACLLSRSGGGESETRVFLRSRFVDLQGLPVDVAAVEAGDGRARFVGIAELDEAEALRLAAALFGGHVGRDDRAERRGEIVELGIGDLLGEISYVKFHLEVLAG